MTEYKNEIESPTASILRRGSRQHFGCLQSHRALSYLLVRGDAEARQDETIAEAGRYSACWQSGYGAFSVSHSKSNEVDAYIRGQQKHLETLSFQDEF